MQFVCLQTLFPVPILKMDGVVWMRPLSPITLEGVIWMPFPNGAAALRYLHSMAGGLLTKLHHTQVTKVAKSNATHDSWAFNMEKPPSLTFPLPSTSPSLSQSGATLQPLTLFFLGAVWCACCGANICGTRYTCKRCHEVVDEACLEAAR